MSRKILICGSIAYDHIMGFDGLFSDAIKPEMLSSLSVSFLAEDNNKYFGGCGANIAYNTSLLGLEAILFSVVGKDFEEYEAWLKQSGVNTSILVKSSDKLSSSSYIMSDNNGSQIATFAPGAAGDESLASELPDGISDSVEMAIIAPDNPKRVMNMVDEMIKHGIPYLFDPGQIVHVLNKDELNHAIKHSRGLITNYYEANILKESLELNYEETSKLTKFFIVTLGADGADVYEDGEKTHLDAVPAESVVDPTGCGDAFRAALIYGLLEGKELVEAAKWGVLLGAIAVASKGSQCHGLGDQSFEARLKSVY